MKVVKEKSWQDVSVRYSVEGHPPVELLGGLRSEITVTGFTAKTHISSTVSTTVTVNGEDGKGNYAAETFQGGSAPEWVGRLIADAVVQTFGLAPREAATAKEAKS